MLWQRQSGIPSGRRQGRRYLSLAASDPCALPFAFQRRSSCLQIQINHPQALVKPRRWTAARPAPLLRRTRSPRDLQLLGSSCVRPYLLQARLLRGRSRAGPSGATGAFVALQIVSGMYQT